MRRGDVVWVDLDPAWEVKRASGVLLWWSATTEPTAAAKAWEGAW